MPAPSAARWASLASLLAVAGAAPTSAATLSTFDRTFQASGEAAFLHATILFVASGAAHRMELWRDHERRLRRDTDGRLTTIATRGAGAGYGLLMLDRARRLSTRVSRDNLYRIGDFTDWFDLGHGLRHPRGIYRLTPTTRAVPPTLPATVRRCRWYDLDEQRRLTHVCWDTRSRFPLLIADSAWRPVWRVTAVDEQPIAARWFVADDRGYVRADVNEDVEGD